MTAGPARFAHVALPLPLATPYTYRIPETLADRAAPGARAVVPVRARELVASSRPSTSTRRAWPPATSSASPTWSPRSRRR